MDSLTDLLGVVGGLLGAITFFWKLWDTFSAYVRIEVEVAKSDAPGDPHPTVATTIENQGFVPKRVHYAALLVAPEGVRLARTSAALARQLGAADAGNANGADPLAVVFRNRAREPVHTPDGQFALIPLPFFFDEQRQLGNERVRYRSGIAAARLQPDRSYTVVFVVFLRYPLGLVRIRMTSDLLRTPPSLTRVEEPS